MEKHLLLPVRYLTRADGGKFGKTEKGNIWLDPAKTSPYHFFQFWLNASDEDAEKWIRIFTFLKRDEIQMLLKKHHENPADRILQKNLAKEVTIFIHGLQEYEQALDTTEKLFSQTGAAEKLSEQDLHALEGIVKSTYSFSEISRGVDLVRFLAETGILPSKGEARKMIQNGGISINRNKVENVQYNIGTELLLASKIHTCTEREKEFLSGGSEIIDMNYSNNSRTFFKIPYFCALLILPCPIV